jgi:hypothetical protein
MIQVWAMKRKENYKGKFLEITFLPNKGGDVWFFSVYVPALAPVYSLWIWL